MNPLEAAFAIIGAWCTLSALAACTWILLRRHVNQRPRRRGGLLDLTPAPDSRKNARGES